MKHSIGTRTHTLMLSIVSAIAVISVVSFMYLYRQYDVARDQLQQTVSGATGSEIESLVDTIGVYMELPNSETPTIATVTDVSKLPSIPFFARAKSGDKVLIYSQAAKAILYRPSNKKIIDVSVFDTQNPTSSQTIKRPVAVEIRNGTTVAGITGTFEKKVKEMAGDVLITEKNSAKHREYTESLVIAGSAAHTKAAEKLAGMFNLVVSPLPRTEASTSADILIILGKDIIEAL